MSVAAFAIEVEKDDVSARVMTSVEMRLGFMRVLRCWRCVLDCIMYCTGDEGTVDSLFSGYGEEGDACGKKEDPLRRLCRHLPRRPGGGGRIKARMGK